MALFANEAQFLRFKVFFGACSLQNGVGEPPPPLFFLAFYGKSRLLPFYVASLEKICM